MNYAVSAYFNGTLVESGSLKTYDKARSLAELWKRNHGVNVDRIKIHSFKSWAAFRQMVNGK